MIVPLPRYTSPNFLKVVEYIAEQIVCYNKHGIIAVTGSLGSGKSTFAIAELAPLLQWFLSQKLIDLEKNVLYIPKAEDIERHFHSMKRYDVVVVDEGRKSMSKYDWQQKAQQKLLSLYNISRNQNKVTIMLLAGLKLFSKELRNDLIQYEFRIIDDTSESEDEVVEDMANFVGTNKQRPKKCYCIVSNPNPETTSDDRWDVDNNEKIRESFFKRHRISHYKYRTAQSLIDAEGKCPTWVCSFRFGKYQSYQGWFHKRYHDEYNRLKSFWHAKDGEENNVVVSKKDLAQIMVEAKMFGKTVEQHPKWNNNQMAKYFGFSEYKAGKLRKAWNKIKDTIREDLEV
jgi:hypothetical protein